MKKPIMMLAVLFLALGVQAQQDKSQRKSPPMQAKAEVGGTAITIDYSAPSVNERKIWGELVPYGKVWRAGANESTSIEVSKDVKIEGKELKAGKYALFVIPTEKQWTIVINKTIAWGAYEYKEADDVLRFDVPVQKSKEFREKMAYEVADNGKVTIGWENVEVSFMVK